jgi:hypothetical protein
LTEDFLGGLLEPLELFWDLDLLDFVEIIFIKQIK